MEVIEKANHLLEIIKKCFNNLDPRNQQQHTGLAKRTISVAFSDSPGTHLNTFLDDPIIIGM